MPITRREGAMSSGMTVVKFCGSTVGAEDTSLEGVVALAEQGNRRIGVHGSLCRHNFRG